MWFSPKRSQPKKSKVRRVWRWFKTLVVLGIIFALFGAWYMHHLTRSIETRFEMSQKWKIPSKVFSDAEYLYPGADMALRDIRGKLGRLGYRDMGLKITGPGDFAYPSKNVLEIYLHDFDYPGEKFTGFPLRVETGGNAVANLTNLQTGEALSNVRLEPELVAPLFSDEMEDRTLITLADVPKPLIEAVILIEDERFFKHKGVDPVGIMRAAVKDLFAMKIVQGGSTLTQQLVKNYFLHSKKTITRKINEALLAMILERRHTKAEILEAYLNEIYLGQRGRSSVMGVGEASKLYFAKNVDQLTLGECALLAGLIKSPSEYSPFRNKDKARARRDFVLDRMYDDDLISARELADAKAEVIVTPPRPAQVVKAPYFIDFVKQQIGVLYTPEVLTSEGMRIFTTLDLTAQLEAERAVADGLKKLETTYATQLPKGYEGKLEGALIAIQPQTGYIRALVGGRNFETNQYNHITLSKRQPGSTFKPFTYLTAFDPKRSKKPFAPSDYIDDKKFTVKAGGEDWTPSNYDKKEHGEVTLRKALEESYNIATAKLGIEAGLENVVQTARDIGITSDLLAVPSLSLGAFEVSPLELAAAYTIFPNAGVRAEPISVINVVDQNGTVLERRTLEMKRVFDAAPVYITTNVMKGVLDRGTAAAARNMGFRGIAAGKTGTTSDFRDAWFAGFTPQLLALVWVGYDDNTTTNMSGSRAALPIWTEFMKEYVGDSQEDFTSPKDVILVKIDPESGELATKNCPKTSFEPFVEGAEPSTPCKLHPEAGILKKLFGK
jgi:penicillin-binding protein 1B